MRSFVKWMLVVGLVAVMAGPALAQDKGKGGRGQGKGGQGRGQGGGRGGLFGGAQNLLANASVQEEIKVTEDQKTKIQEFVGKEREEMMARFQPGGERPTPEQLAEMGKKTADAREKFAKETLKDEQFKRYSQIRLQNSGIGVFTEEKVASELKFTGEQKDKMKALAADYQKDLQELNQSARGGGGNFQEIAEKRTSLTKDFMTKATKALTADQQSKWKELTGKEFTVRPDMGGGRRGRGGDKDK